jgi:hypothetical protein
MKSVYQAKSSLALGDSATGLLDDVRDRGVVSEHLERPLEPRNQAHEHAGEAVIEWSAALIKKDVIS